MSILPLLPLRALSVTLRFTAPTHFPFYHQPVITAWLRHLVGKTPDYPQYISIDTPEAACIEYPENTCYRFSIFIQPGGGGLLEKIIGQLQNLPHSVKKHGDKLALSDNAQLEQLVDLFSGKTISNAAELSEYDEAALNADINLWQYCPQLSIRTLSPLRILLPKSQRQQHDYKNEARFCRLASEVNFSHLQQRLYDSLNEHLRRKQQASMPPPADKTAMRYRDLFWIDNHYTNSNGKHKPMGGLLGLMQIDSRQFEREQWGCWILGQYLGIGQHRVFGWGRYRLETPEGEYSLKRSAQAHSLLRSATRLDKLQQACEYENPDLQHLESISEQLQQQNYTVPELQGVVLEKTGKKPRPLAIPPSYDRIAQRAVAQSLSPALDSLMYHDSHAYRKQHSRHKAKQSIHLAYQKGYRWIYESDIASYFDTLDWFCMETRLHAFLGDDPLVTQIMRWLTAPVRHEGKRIPRRQGLPQGSPLSPLVSNLMLDAFDSDLETAGYWLIRFADDFVIPCKTKEQAIAAGQTANASLMQLGLECNQDKTRICSFAEGFRYLGYLFVNDLALDVGGEKAPSFAAQVPPESWLAQVETQKQKTAEKALEKKTGIAIGEREQQQALDLVLCGEKALLSTHEARLYIQQGEAEKNSIPWSHLRSILLFGQHHITTPALKAAFKHHVAIHYASGNGIYQGMSSSAHTQHQHSELWLMQQLCFQNEQTSLAAACSIVAARLRHQAEVLRVRQKQSEFTQAIQQLQNLVNKTRNAQDKTQLNGYEGKGASIYFQSLQTLIPEAFGFTGRNRRPPRDPFNVLLSMGYTSLYNHVQSLCYAAGLSPWTGVYHQPHGEHAVLASDLMEPFRHIIERTALSSIMLKQIKLADFKESAEGCFMNTQTRKTWLALLHKNFDKTFKARGETEARNLYQHIQAQNQQLILWIRGEKPSFQAWRLR